jgi:hypothetical protein
MSRKFLIIETYFGENRQQNFYYLMLPDLQDKAYRSSISFNAFFYSTRSPQSNVTNVRQFTASHESEIKYRKVFFKNVDWDNLKTFDSIWDFYKFIGYNYKTRKYESGERMRPLKWVAGI